MAYILYIYTKKGFLRVQNFVILSLWQFLAILAIKIAEFFKLEHFLRPFLKTRSHDRSAHTFGSSHRYLEVPRSFKKIGIFLK